MTRSPLCKRWGMINRQPSSGRHRGQVNWVGPLSGGKGVMAGVLTPDVGKPMELYVPLSATVYRAMQIEEMCFSRKG
jgi:hypothetical protein